MSDDLGARLKEASLLEGELTCRTAGGETLAAEMLHTDEDFDLALLRVETDGLKTVVWRTGAPPAPCWGTYCLAEEAICAAACKARLSSGSPPATRKLPIASTSCWRYSTAN